MPPDFQRGYGSSLSTWGRNQDSVINVTRLGGILRKAFETSIEELERKLHNGIARNSRYVFPPPPKTLLAVLVMHALEHHA